jgi:hypothetical protein
MFPALQERLGGALVRESIAKYMSDQAQAIYKLLWPFAFDPEITKGQPAKDLTSGLKWKDDAGFLPQEPNGFPVLRILTWEICITRKTDFLSSQDFAREPGQNLGFEFATRLSARTHPGVGYDERLSGLVP